MRNVERTKEEKIAYYKEQLAHKLALPEVKLSIGAGLHWKQPFEEWINHDGLPSDHVDVISDFSELPFEDKTFDFVEMGDVVEHVHRFDQDKIFKEWNRICKIGCKIRVSTPNLHRCCVEYAEGKMTLEILIQNIYAWGTTPFETHYITFTVATLTELLQRFGFGQIDFSQSPGVDHTDDKNMAWWLVATAVKERDV